VIQEEPLIYGESHLQYFLCHFLTLLEQSVECFLAECSLLKCSLALPNGAHPCKYQDVTTCYMPQERQISRRRSHQHRGPVECLRPRPPSVGRVLLFVLRAFWPSSFWSSGRGRVHFTGEGGTMLCLLRFRHSVKRKDDGNSFASVEPC
jgi:hypothetical protein